MGAAPAAPIQVGPEDRELLAALVAGVRLVWVLGPPGGGKSTLASWLQDAVSPAPRVTELASMLGPLVVPGRQRAGVAKAKQHLVATIRSVELHAANTMDPPLIVVSARLPPRGLEPFGERERILLVLPEYDDWWCQWSARTAAHPRSSMSDDPDAARRAFMEAQEWAMQPEPPLFLIRPRIISQLIGLQVDEHLPR